MVQPLTTKSILGFYCYSRYNDFFQLEIFNWEYILVFYIYTIKKCDNNKQFFF